MKNRSAIIILFLANTISGIAQGISMLAIPWYFAQNNLMGRFALVYILTNVIAIFWVPYAGTLVDKYDRKHVFLAVTAIAGTLLFIISGVGFANDGLPWWMVALVFMLTFFNYNIHYPTLYAFMQEITEPVYYARITSLLEIVGQVATMLAGAFGAMLLEGTQNGMLNIFGFLIRVPFEIPAWQIHEIFTMDAVTYFIAFAILLLVRYSPLRTRSEELGPILERLKTGFRYLVEHKYIFLFGVASYAVFVTVLVEGFYLNAIYVKQHLLETGDVFAASEMYYGLGAIFAGVTIQWLFRRLRIPAAVIIMTLMGSAIFFTLFLTREIWVFYIVSLALGLNNAGTRILRVTYLFRNVPNQVYGRANSIFTLTNILLRVLFLALFSLPFFLRENNVIYANLILSGFLLLAAAVLMRYYRKFA